MQDEELNTVRSITFADDFTFKTIMEGNDKICAQVVERILGVKVDHIVYKQTEKTSAPSISARSIRMDVYLEDEAGTVIDVEMQKTHKGDLLRRLRYY